MFLLDTDILSNLVRKKPPTALVEKIASVPKGQQFTSIITLGELVFGAHKRRGWRTEVLLREIDIFASILSNTSV